MSVKQFIPGLTYTLLYHFRDGIGDLTSVDTPVVNVYTPEKSLYQNALALTTTSTTGEYRNDFYVPSGLTVGHWSSLAVGITNGGSIFSEFVPFEVIDPVQEPFWVGLTEFRDYLELPDDDHTRDDFLKQCLQAGVELVEGYTQRSYGLKRHDELFEIKTSDRLKLTYYPISAIIGITATTKIIPRSNTNLVNETVDENGVLNIYYRLDADNGIVKFTDSAGFDQAHDGILVAISYMSGFPTIPEPVRQAAFALSSALVNLASSEGISTIRLSDLSFALSRNLFNGHIGELLAPYRNIAKI